MDFKVAGTQRGITGIQLDLKIDGISEEIIRATLAQATRSPHRNSAEHARRRSIVRVRKFPSSAPRLLRTKIDPEKIGLLIGPGGKTIRGIQESTGAVIEVDDDGTVIVASDNMESANAALAKVEALTASVQVGQHLRRPRHQRQGLRRVHRNPAGPRRLVPYQRTG